LFYCANPITDAAHEIWIGADYFVCGVLAFSGAHATPFDMENGAVATQPGSVTPSQNDSLIITAVRAAAGSTPTIDSGFTEFALGNVGGVHIPGGIAYLIQSTAAAVNPTWTVSGGSGIQSVIAAFKPE
jgi:hypothetical protein